MENNASRTDIRRKLARALVFMLIAAVCVSAGMAGCTQKKAASDDADTQETPPPTSDSVYGEAPVLAVLVAAGELPPVDERLPVNPVIVQPVERVGVYGGTWRMGVTKPFDRKVFRINSGYENLLRFDPAWTRIIPNIAQSYEVSDDSSEFTFHLREGLRWSDGVPFTADDIVFWYEADMLNEELHTSIPSYLVVDDTPVVVEKIDSYTVKFTFAGPYGQFLYQLADVKTDYITACPMHYLKQFHPGYNLEGIDALIADAGVENWVELYKSRWNPDRNPELPTMNGWVLADRPNETSTSISMERNPYYWKIDTDFNQLPYIDSIEFVIYQKRSDILLAARNGQIDAQFVTLSIKDSNYEDWAAYMAAGKYELHTLVNPRSNYLSVQLNLVHKDPVLRVLFSDKTFRIALSRAINRSEIIDHVLGIPLEPRQPAPLRESPYYRERLETQYTEFDLPFANQLLDEAAYDERDKEGYRLTPEGRRIEFTISIVKDPVYLGAARMLSVYWRELGILVNIEELEAWQWVQLIRANGHDAVVTSVQGGLDVVENPGVYMPFSESDSSFAMPWLHWYQGKNSGEEPPAPVKEQFQLYERIKASVDPHETERLMGEILAIAEEEFYVMGICRPEDFYMLVKLNFHNVPRTMPKSFSYPTPAPTNPCQYFIEPHE